MASFNKSEIMNKIIREATKQGVPVDLALALANQESGFNPRVKSSAGAMGVMQLMPATARGLGVSDPYNADQNIEGGIKYLKSMLNRFNGNVEMALAAYNAGPNAVEKYKGIPPYKETQNYVKNITSGRKNYAKVVGNAEKIALNVEDATSSQSLANRYQGQITGAAANPYDYIASKEERDKMIKAAEEQDKQYRNDIKDLIKLNMPQNREQLTDLEREAYDYNFMNDISEAAQQLQQTNAANLAQGYQQLAQQSAGMNDLLQQKYQAMRDLAMSDPRLQQGNYQVTPEQINNYQALNLQNQLAANVFGRPQLQLTSPQELARQQYEAQLANQYGVPYDTLVAAQADRIKNLGAIDTAEIAFLQNRAAAGDTIAQEYLKQIGAGGGVKDIIKEGVTAQGDIAKERIKATLERRNKAAELAQQALQAGNTALFQYYASIANNENTELGAMTRGLITSADNKYKTDVDAMVTARGDDLTYSSNMTKNQIDAAKVPSENFKNTAEGTFYLGAADPTISAGDWLNLFPAGVKNTVVNPQLSTETVNNILSSGTAGPRPNPTSANSLNKAFLDLRNLAYPNQPTPAPTTAPVINTPAAQGSSNTTNDWRDILYNATNNLNNVTQTVADWRERLRGAYR